MVVFAGAEDKLAQIDRNEHRRHTVALGMPSKGRTFRDETR
jgi:hypothetical protein